MEDNKMCRACKYGRCFPAPYTVLCDFPRQRKVILKGDTLIECEAHVKREAKSE